MEDARIESRQVTVTGFDLLLLAQTAQEIVAARQEDQDAPADPRPLLYGAAALVSLVGAGLGVDQALEHFSGLVPEMSRALSVGAADVAERLAAEKAA